MAGLPVAEDPVVVSIVELHKAGYVTLPTAAQQYAAANTELATCVAPEAASRYFPRSVPAFNEARDVLGGILRDTGTTLADVGDALVKVAKGYRLTDDEVAEYNRQVGEQVPPSTVEPLPRHGRYSGV